MRAAIYDLETGHIRQVASAPPGVITRQMDKGEGYFLLSPGETCDDTTMWYDRERMILRPKEALEPELWTKHLVLRIENIPLGSIIKVGQWEGQAVIECDDDGVEVAFDVPGKHYLCIDAGAPYLLYECEVEINAQD